MTQRTLDSRAVFRTYFRASVLLFTTLFASVLSFASDATLQQQVEAILNEERLTGVAWSLIGAGPNPILGVAGFGDGEAAEPFGLQSKFHVGSVTKAVLATGILRLVTEGRIDLDDPAVAYLPKSLGDSVASEFRDVTVRHLLDHTAGLNDAYLWQMFSLRAEPDAPLDAAFPEPTTQLEIRSTAGTQFSYSNMGYTLLGLVIETVTGERYEAYLDRQLLAPLGMHDSTFFFTSQTGEYRDSRLVWGHVDDGSQYEAQAMFLRPAGQFTTTVGDLAKYIGFLLGDGEINGEVFIDQTLMRTRGRPIGTDAAAAGLTAGYALGLGRRDRHGVVGLCHGGNIVGFAAMLCIFPQENKGFAYSVNTDSEVADYGRLDALFVEALGIGAAEAPENLPSAPDVDDWLGWYVLSPNRFSSFEYLDTVFGAAQIVADGGGLTLKPLQGNERNLRPIGGNLYSAHDRSTQSHVLLRDANQEHLVSDGFKTYRKVSPWFLYAHWISVALGLSGILWLLTGGAVILVKQRRAFLSHTIAPAFVCVVAIVLPIPLFSMQSFMALGDVTAASVSLAVVTVCIPVGMMLTLLRVYRSSRGSRADLLHGIAAAAVLQWSLVLAANDFLPLQLWA